MVCSRLCDASPAGTAFTLRADANAVLVTGVTPSAGANNQVTTVTVNGAGFLPGFTVELIAANSVVTAARTVATDSTTQLTATLTSMD